MSTCNRGKKYRVGKLKKVHVTLGKIKLIKVNIQIYYQMLCFHQGVINYRKDLFFSETYLKVNKWKYDHKQINLVDRLPITAKKRLNNDYSQNFWKSYIKSQVNRHTYNLLLYYIDTQLLRRRTENKKNLFKPKTIW